MRIALVIYNAYADHTSGAARSMRIVMEWLAAAGHECRVLANARFDTSVPVDVEKHLQSLGVPYTRSEPSSRRPKTGDALAPAERAVIDFRMAGVRVHTLLTEKNARTERDPAEGRQFMHLLAGMLREFRPSLVLSYGGHPVLQAALRHARTRGIGTVFSLRNHGYTDRRWYRYVDHVLTNSPYLSRTYAAEIGLRSTPIVSPIAWSEVLAPEETRGFVTFVNPSLHKGAALFTRLAHMLGSARPDIPLLIVESAVDASALASIPNLDLAKYPQIVVSPPLARPADIFALTKVLLVPSTFEEPFGRVAAEAMINGIPPLVSDRGALPETVAEGGRVLALPSWMTASTRRVPSVAETKPWFDAVTELWDDPGAYARAASAAKAVAHRLYDETRLREQYVSYFESLRPGGKLFDDA